MSRQGQGSVCRCIYPESRGGLAPRAPRDHTSTYTVKGRDRGHVLPATPVAYGLLCCSFRCQGILPGAETIRGRVGKAWAHRQQGDCPWGTRYCLQCRKEIVCNDPCDQDRAHAAFQAHTSKVGEIRGYRMQRRCVSRNQKTIGNTRAKHGTMRCWCLRMNTQRDQATSTADLPGRGP